MTDAPQEIPALTQALVDDMMDEEQRDNELTPFLVTMEEKTHYQLPISARSQEEAIHLAKKQWELGEMEPTSSEVHSCEAITAKPLEIEPVEPYQGKRYRVVLDETVRYTLEVTADDPDEAEEAAHEIWAQSADPMNDFPFEGQGTTLDSIEEIKP